MEKHQFLCPYCNETESVGVHAVGQRITCSHCGSLIIVPPVGEGTAYRPIGGRS